MTEQRNHGVGFDRRTFLLGAVSAGVAASCGGDDRGPSAADPSLPPVATNVEADSTELAAGTFSLIQRFPSDVLVVGDVRLPFSLSSETAQFVTDGPTKLGAQILDLDGAPVGQRIEGTRRDVVPAPYYAFRTQIDAPGVYAIVVDGGPPEGANFQVFDAADVTLPKPGDVLAGFETPTPDQPDGVDPICTRDPACEFHAVALTEALDTEKGVAYFVGTPALCQTGSCTPALEALIDVAPEFANEFVFVHAEVYTDSTATAIAPAVVALNVQFEPLLFITDPAGVIVERLDGLWDVTELRERLLAAV